MSNVHANVPVEQVHVDTRLADGGAQKRREAQSHGDGVSCEMCRAVALRESASPPRIVLLAGAVGLRQRLEAGPAERARELWRGSKQRRGIQGRFECTRRSTCSNEHLRVDVRERRDWNVHDWQLRVR